MIIYIFLLLLGQDTLINQREIDQVLADMFFSCNIPFLTFESVYFKRFVNLLNPAYKIPSRRTLSTSLLDNRFSEFQNSIVQIESGDATLLIDGWKNSVANKKTVVGMLRLYKGRYVFLQSWNFSNLSETGDALNNVVNESVNTTRENTI